MKHVITRTLAALGVLAASARAQDGMLFPSTAGSYVNVASTPDLSPQNAITVEAWFYVDPASPIGGNRPAIVRKDPIGILLHPPEQRQQLRTPRVDPVDAGLRHSTVTSPNLTPLLSWHHYAGTYDGSAMRMYLDGVEIGSTPKTGLISIAPGPVTLGQGGVRTTPGTGTSTRSGSGPWPGPWRRSNRRCFCGSTTSPD